MNISNKSVLITGAQPWYRPGPLDEALSTRSKKSYMRERAALYNILINA